MAPRIVQIGLVFADEVVRAVVAVVDKHTTNAALLKGTPYHQTEPSNQGSDHGSIRSGAGALSTPFGDETPAHLLTTERPTWMQLVEQSTTVLRDRGFDVH